MYSHIDSELRQPRFKSFVVISNLKQGVSTPPNILILLGLSQDKWHTVTPLPPIHQLTKPTNQPTLFPFQSPVMSIASIMSAALSDIDRSHLFKSLIIASIMQFTQCIQPFLFSMITFVVVSDHSAHKEQSYHTVLILPLCLHLATLYLSTGNGLLNLPT